MSMAFNCILFLMFFVALFAVAIAWRTMSRMQKHLEAERQVRLCFHAARLGDKELWVATRDKALKLLREMH